MWRLEGNLQSTQFLKHRRIPGIPRNGTSLSWDQTGQPVTHPAPFPNENCQVSVVAVDEVWVKVVVVVVSVEVVVVVLVIDVVVVLLLEDVEDVDEVLVAVVLLEVELEELVVDAPQTLSEVRDSFRWHKYNIILRIIYSVVCDEGLYSSIIFPSKTWEMEEVKHPIYDSRQETATGRSAGRWAGAWCSAGIWSTCSGSAAGAGVREACACGTRRCRTFSGGTRGCTSVAHQQ